MNTSLVLLSLIAASSHAFKPSQSIPPYTSRQLRMKDDGISSNRNNPLNLNELNNALYSEVCAVETNDLAIEKPSFQKDVIRNFAVTILSSALMTPILPSVKQLGLAGIITLNKNLQLSHLRKSLIAIGPIVTFTVNAPPALNKLLQATPGLKSLPHPIKVGILSTIKHFWVWPHESNLNAVSSGLKQASNLNPIVLFSRRSSHAAREAVLIQCVSQPECGSLLDKIKSYALLAIIQSIFDRQAFPTSINPVFTVLSRFLYLMTVKEIIELSTFIITNLMSRFEKKLPIVETIDTLLPRKNITNIEPLPFN